MLMSHGTLRHGTRFIELCCLQKDEAAVMKKLREAFDEVDTDQSGSLDYGELKVMLHKAGFMANDSTMRVSTSSHSDLLAFLGFLALCYKLCTRQ